MLVLSRERDQAVVIGDDIEVRVVDVRGDKVRLGVIAPRSVSVHRREVYDTIQRSNAGQPLDGKTTEVPRRDDQSGPPVRLAVLISGAGSTLKNLIDHIAARHLNATIAVVIASKPGIGGIAHAEAAGLPVVVVERKQTPDVAAFSSAVFAAVDAAGVDLVVMAGWLSVLDIPARFAGHVMNIHPALLPSFGGRGMYGRHVHEAVLASGCKISGCTVHFVDNEIDAGPIVLQRTAPVYDDDTPATLAERVGNLEREAYTHAIELYRAGRLRVENRLVRIVARTA